MNIIPCTALDILQHPDFAALKAEYIEECANAKLPRPEEKFELYAHLDSSGCLFGFAAVDGERLLGFVLVLAAELPHYGRLIAVTESLFVAKKYRNTGAGLKLIRSAEQCAKDVGSPAIMISAPLGGSLDTLLPRMGYEVTNRAHTKELL